MSSNAALSAARRRRVGQPQVSNNQQTSSNNSQPKQQNNVVPKPTTPIEILKQHQNRIQSLETEITNLKETTNDPNEIYSNILSYVTEQFDFKAFQDNLDNVVIDFEKMRELIISQQVYLNNLNINVMEIMSKMKIEQEQAEDETTKQVEEQSEEQVEEQSEEQVVEQVEEQLVEPVEDKGEELVEDKGEEPVEEQ